METPEEIALRDATLTTGTWTVRAKNLIDSDFGDGYAAAHPELVIAFLKAAAIAYMTDRLARVIEQVASEVADALDEADA